MESGEKQSILIVDDISSNIDILVSELENGYNLRIALDGKSALDSLEDGLPDLILLDIMMPGLNGYEVCEKLKSSPLSKDIPVIFVTSLDEVEDETKGLDLGAIDYITRPFSMPIVKKRIKNHLKMKQYQDKLLELSNEDGLTGVSNRRHFDEMLDYEWNLSIRYEKRLSVIILDVDYFKLFNDNYGHIQGDQCLIKISHAMTDLLLRSNDLFARYGGEEFICLLPEMDKDGLLHVGEKLRKGVEDLKIPHEKSDISSFVTISLGGVTFVPCRDSSYNDILIHADKMLYEAKEKGRNRLIIEEIIPKKSLNVVKVNRKSD